ncbi:sugar phosphate isomerase/epimerase family protein [Mycolicibacterium smegmatis]|uniref:Xylose isomerase-like TIM barrel n=3 Tax=Mycolicibacterium smegmatis TaxID=1772 RepID=I7G5H5_MYCS2|nr:sugar phosphate isomerase/epimerase [Mycolicibacterium smegmatis]ABK75307.1 sugar phosphate isomerase/epimerase [Mycolicibacterium smegmatis MC2 155]AFP38431.1 Xylose isomerase-like TIM barrel [Mycolicibacterium smegmatis MC2 155]AIU07220.1 sugar phosphate isomerase [Mycolicibacterium smegmatis MC2 155]AIU13845.1 sugar phosphate isomerase [Mycolicibacterium smegmatis]AIU20469.1 sugar phosphate isomerase [Mycolicibacterium smegmatis]
MNIENRDLLATCWTWAGNAAPARGTERSPIPMAERLDAVASAGWEGVGIVYADLAEIASTTGLPTLRSMLDDHGIKHVELEFITNWWTTGEQRRESDAMRDDLFEAAAVLGATTLKAAACLQAFGETSVDRERFASAFDELATRAGSHGLRVAIEPMPMSNLPSIIDGVAFIKDVGNPHGGLCIDTWHVHRSGTDYRKLAEIVPVEHVFVVELTDADAEVVGPLWEDAVDRRRIPGLGSIDVAQFVAEMHRAGWRGHWGVEIISEEHRHWALDVAVNLTREKTLETIASADQLLDRAAGRNAGVPQHI